ncbi:MAG: PAS domain S-box protein [Planctomycetes bacterium]|nr:PAS domain S-box protein [Planctomycetota bacterium]
MPNSPRGVRTRWTLIALALSTFGALTLLAGAWTSWTLVQRMRNSAEQSSELAFELASLNGLLARSLAVNTPGNDIFSGEPPKKVRARISLALAEYRIANDALASRPNLEAQVAEDLQSAARAVQRVADLGFEVVDAIEDGDTPHAAAIMATMDAQSQDAMRRLLDTASRLQARQRSELEERAEEAAAFHSAVTPLLAAVVLTLIAFATFGVRTTRRSAEERDRESRAAAQLAAVRDAIFLIDPATLRFVDVNAAAVKLTGRAREALLRASPLDLDVKLSEDSIRAVIGDLHEDRPHPPPFETAIERGDGRRIPVEVQLELVPHVGERGMILAVLRDLTEVIATRRALENHKTAIDAHAVVAVTDRRGRIVHANQKFCEISGYTRNELLGQDHRLLNSGLHDPRFFSEMYRAIHSGNVWHGELRNRRKDGHYYWVDTTIVPLRDESDAIDGFIAVRTDMTRLKETEQRLELAVRASKQGLWDWDLRTDEVYFNDEWYTMLGYEPQELPMTLETWMSLVHPDDTAQSAAAIERHLRGESETFMVETRLRGKSGDWRWVQATGAIVEWSAEDEPTRMSGVHVDIDERHRAQVRLDELVAQAKMANEAKSEFLANMSHEIRTPMTAVLGFSDLLVDSEISESDRQQYASIIRKNGQHLLSIINDILDLSKIEAGKLTIERLETPLRSLISETITLNRVRADEKGILLGAKFESRVPAAIHTDPTRLRQVLVNLVGNAVKFTDRGSVELSVRYRRVEETGRGELSIAVSDTGIGLSEEQIGHLFQPFTQADGSTTRRYGGTGLGLAISRHLIERLDGRLGVTSEPGRGSTFTVTLDVDAVPEASLVDGSTPADEGAPSPPTRADAERANRRLASQHILIAEDGLDNQRLIAFHLKRHGAEIECVENGRLAVERVHQRLTAGRPFDLVLMDMQMPEMDGYEALRLLRADGIEIPMIALTANAMLGDRERCLEAGADDYLPKPIDVPRLIEVCARMIEHAV